MMTMNLETLKMWAAMLAALKAVSMTLTKISADPGELLLLLPQPRHNLKHFL